MVALMGVFFYYLLKSSLAIQKCFNATIAFTIFVICLWRVGLASTKVIPMRSNRCLCSNQEAVVCTEMRGLKVFVEVKEDGNNNKVHDILEKGAHK